MSRQSVDNTLNKRTKNRQADNGHDDSGKGGAPRAMPKCIYIAYMVWISSIVLFKRTKTNRWTGRRCFRETLVKGTFE